MKLSLDSIGGGLAEIDQRYIDALAYLKGLLKKLDCYTGHKP